VPVLEPLISSFCESRAPVAPVYFKRASSHWSVFAPFEGRIYLSQGLGPLEGLSYLVRDRSIECPQSWLQSRAVGAPFQAPRPRA
jgi:hypothetical protein